MKFNSISLSVLTLSLLFFNAAALGMKAASSTKIEDVDVSPFSLNFRKSKQLINDQLIEAARYGNMKQVKALLTMPGIDVNHVNSTSTALMFAVVNNRIDIVKALLAMPGIDVNHVNMGGQTALKLAVAGDRIGIVNALLAKQLEELSKTAPSKTEYFTSGTKALIVQLRQ